MHINTIHKSLKEKNPNIVVAEEAEKAVEAGPVQAVAQAPDSDQTKVMAAAALATDQAAEAIPITLLPKDAIYYLCQAQIERALPVEELAVKMQNRNLECRICGSMINAYQNAQNDAHAEDIVFVGGSCFVVGELLSELGKGK